jgi:hypothetical protein
MSQFARSLRQSQILILEILNVFLWLKLSPFLTLNKLKHFETGSLFETLDSPSIRMPRHGTVRSLNGRFCPVGLPGEITFFDNKFFNKSLSLYFFL